MSKIIAYAFNSDIHCVYCTHMAGMSVEGAIDFNGNEVHPVFSTDECPEDGEYCGDCGDIIREGYEVSEPDDSMDGDHASGLASAGFGTDEDYGYYGDEGYEMYGPDE